MAENKNYFETSFKIMYDFYLNFSKFNPEPERDIEHDNEF